MRGIKALHINWLKNLTPEGASHFLEALERNTELKDVSLYNGFAAPDTHRLIKEMRPKMELQMALNRAGKRISSSRRAMFPTHYGPKYSPGLPEILMYSTFSFVKSHTFSSTKFLLVLSLAIEQREIDSGAFSTRRCLSDFRMIITYLLGPFYCTGIALDTLNVDQAVYSFDERVLY